MEFWTRLPKSKLLTAIASAPPKSRLSAAKRSEHMKACSKLKKDELAAKAEAAYAKDHYLPDLLIGQSHQESDVAEPCASRELAA